MDYSKVKTAGIIGAGVAGLATARTLQAIGVECTVFERQDRLGGVWTDGYLDYGVQVQKELYEFPDYPLPPDTPQFTPGPVMQQYLEDYADNFDIRKCIRYNTPVVKVARAAGKSEGWRVSSKSAGKTSTQQFDLVVVCVGLYSNIPFVPDVPGQENFQGDIHHIKDLKSADLLDGKNIAVIGYGKSATDAALSASKHGQSAHIIARKLHWPVPRNLAGILPFKWGLLNRLTVTVIPPYKTLTALEHAVHSVGKPLVWLFWRVVELLLFFQCRLGSNFGTRVSLVPDEKAEFGAFSEATMVPRPAFYKSVRNGDISFHLGEIEQFDRDGVTLTDGNHIKVDTVIFGTGWRSDYSYLSAPLKRELGFADDGIYLYRQILHPNAPGLAFVGYASTVSNILAYCMQARWLAALIEGRHQLPDQTAMQREIDTLARWKRSWMPFSHARAARLIVHLQHYLDELLQDIGVNHLRKKGLFAPLAEVFAPYQPSDYRSVAKDDWALREGL
ncbi:MAG: NAD(P)-binding domain-containing protein [Rhizobiales bacterium]|nr:NAD(P)-binding domain-containing protein [Hyphomicrobiales bacterium]